MGAPRKVGLLIQARELESSTQLEGSTPGTGTQVQPLTAAA